MKRQFDVFSGKSGMNIRQNKESSPKKNGLHIALVLMASGYGKRYGRNKLLAEFSGKSLFAHALEQAAGSGADSICVVTRYPEIRDYVDRWKKSMCRDFSTGKEFLENIRFFSAQTPVNLRIIWNFHPERGISESLRLGLAAQPEADGCCFVVCDQPLLSVKTLRRMMDAFRKHPDSICVCSDGQRRGNPVLFPGDLFGELMQLTGDSGGRQILKKYPGRIREIMVEKSEELYDIDSVKDLEFLKKSF